MMPFRFVHFCHFLSWQVMEIDSMMVNLRMEAVHVKDLFSINWLCASGLVKNIGRVVEEYRHTRRLLVYTARYCVSKVHNC